MKIQRLTGSAATLAVLATTLGALGAAPAHASGPDEPAVKLSSSMVVDGPAEGGFGVTYTLTMSEPRRTEGK